MPDDDPATRQARRSAALRANLRRRKQGLPVETPARGDASAPTPEEGGHLT